MIQADVRELQYAKGLLENPGIAARLTNVLATPIEQGIKLLPKKWNAIVDLASKKSLETALDFAVTTLGKKDRGKSYDLLHKLAVATTGATGGVFGLASIPVELPASTLIMLRSIADIARSEGENLKDAEARLNCLQVFALGGKANGDNASETGYYAIRLSLSKLISDASKYLAERGLTREGAPVLVKFISVISSRFGAVVSEKVAAMAIPAIGAVGGALVNTIFIDHFQNMARGHFIVRRLERKYGTDVVKKEYEQSDKMESPAKVGIAGKIGQSDPAGPKKATY